MTTRQDWKDARAALDAIEAECEALLAPTNGSYDAARNRLDEVVEALDCGEFFGTCISCQEPVFDGDSYHNGADEIMCEGCSPSFADMLRAPQSFLDFQTYEEMTSERAKEICDAHVAAGGNLNDKMMSA